jgi:hypothetical protein
MSKSRAITVLAASLVGLLAAPALAQAPKSSALHGINGSWQRYPTGEGGNALPAGFNLSKPEEKAIAASEPPGPAPIPDPPLRADDLAKWKAEQSRLAALSASGKPPATNYSACIPDGMPAMMMGMFPMEVLETPGQVTIIQEAYNQVRRVILDGTLPPPEDAEPRFAGHSVGKWDGDALVIDTVGVKDYVRFRNVPHSGKMRISERLRLIDADHMEDKVTVTDPEYFTAPWTWTWMYKRWPGYELQEYVCEDNRYTADENGVQKLRIDDAPAKTP